MDGKFRIDSAGTFAMEGAPPHPKSVAVAKEHGIRLEGQSRQLSRHDLSTFDHILVMDRQNLHELQTLAAPSAFGPLEDYHARIRMLAAASVPTVRPTGCSSTTARGCSTSFGERTVDE